MISLRHIEGRNVNIFELFFSISQKRNNEPKELLQRKTVNSKIKLSGWGKITHHYREK